ncbi:MAG: prepilin-type N-terminal cleavage/methylation domain-containing protein [Erysipelotrichia bacterium]|nr:prepilin-type N-terminal cleavage/methylation domain-containing protein [Erysipelotrichia bacterium]
MNKMVNKLKDVRAKLKNSKGFTLIEMLVVVAIIGILVLLALPSYLGYTKDANVATMQADIRVLESAALVSNIDGAGWPVTGNPITTGDAVTFVKGKDPEAEVKAIDKTAIEDQIQSLKNNDEGEYGIITKGKYEGKVVHLDGVEGRDKAENFGLGSDLVKKP